MENSEILKLFNVFLKSYDIEENNQIWSTKSKEFRDFWSDKILNNEVIDITEDEID